MSIITAVFVAAIGAAISLTGGFIGYFVFPEIVENKVEESVRLVEFSEAFKRWENLSIPVAFKVYFFNVSNPDEVQEGAKPIVEEIGPYVYNEYRTKINVTTDEDVISYYQRQIFEFNEESSAPFTDRDEITILNLPLMSVITIADYESAGSRFELKALNATIPSIFARPASVFQTTTPREFLFDGIYLFCNSSSLVEKIVCNRIQAHAPKKTIQRLTDGRFRFTLLAYKNDSHDGYYSINSGLNDVSHLGEILDWENSRSVDTWAENSCCNEVAGSDGTLFPPFRKTDSELTIFSTDICRSLRMKFSEVTEFSGVKGLRFTPLDDLLNSPLNNTENECFCLNKTEGIRGDDGCLLDGAMELWSCQGAPVVFSLPHFYLANTVYKNGVSGLNPDKSLHGIYLDLEPITGTILRGSKRTQFNIFIRPIEHISLTTNLPTTLIPVLWIDESIVLTKELIDLMNVELFDVLDTMLIVRRSVIVGGAILFALGFVWLLMSMRNAKQFHTHVK